MTKFKWLLWLLLLLPNILFAQSWYAQSGEKQRAVLELFTSEGCGLCPAADRWVKTLPEQGIGPEQLIVLGFHIDYLNDKKGWVDRFAQPSFADRQRQLARLNLFQTIYTPEFVVSGEIIHNWQQHVINVVESINNFTPEAALALSVEQQGEELQLHSHVQVEGEDNRRYSKLYIALTEDNIVSEVNGGDNAGQTFTHQHLVRKWLGPFDLDSGGQSDISTTISIEQDWNAQQLAITALVQNLDDGYVLQALNLPLTTQE